MTLHLHQLPKLSRKFKKRLGRGNSSHGNYSGRGMKGQRARSGGRSGLLLKGLKANIQNIPKIKGFTSLQEKPWSVRIGHLEALVHDGAQVTPRFLNKCGLTQHTRRAVKLVAGGTFTKKITLQGIAVTKSVKELIEKNGGSIASK
ncbi:MAG: 50S ribosomal protein L15 [Parcubacteria group bacterium CG08_land_8_20_14_0_20_48_21]|nr:MAG: 50S ribosomal protein L15 [Parcubacteria group bacterium CG2_30_48_51]PIS32642.1 MAG: 50S ribosomal protein L15 [Parcubacteria group bacterium CG08_land_8_20_14_0_20_48_21]PIW79305.1 MAG: 50S ribosomal protein L15 [Parcubacteria group bacterium CG_4_8_14_3_um_filter_48_16]PIY77606.1 MAG: 50S ribosomal protein L15 [Parcubacteria group bacterium CG_4_10_14_0_8_um_filter_48_154]PIZ77191.1 MAG: 50S ribosomal protein L15 [bacterium CG_4_10_14_0_2_um_filter_48_144]PJC40145.1 MAG: 50S ribosom